MAAAKEPTTLTAVCAACHWSGQRSLEKGQDLAAHACPRCGKKDLTEPEE